MLSVVINRRLLRPYVRRWAVIATCALFICLGMFGLAGSDGSVGAQADTVLNLRIEKTISPVKVRVIQRAVTRANESGAQLLIIGLDTPGGLYSSTREIVEILLGSPVPVAVFVSPRGSQAGSAGTFITAAAHIAAMTPALTSEPPPRSPAPARKSAKPWPIRQPTTLPPLSAPLRRSVAATLMLWRKLSAPPPPTAPARPWRQTLST